MSMIKDFWKVFSTILLVPIIQAISLILLVYIPKVTIFKDITNFGLAKKVSAGALIVLISSTLYIGIAFLIGAIWNPNDTIAFTILHTFLFFPILSLILISVLFKWSVNLLSFSLIAILSSVLILNLPDIIFFISTFL